VHTSPIGKQTGPANSHVGNNKKKHKPPPPTPPVRALRGLTLNIWGITPAKWVSIQELPVFSSLDYVILTEHQLNAEFRPDEIIKSGWDFHAVFGTFTTLPQRGYRGQRYRGGLALLTRNSMRFRITMHSLSGAVNTILGDSCKSLNSRGSVHSSGTSPSLHQAVTWSLSSPFYNDTIHLTGMYIFLNEGNLEEFFDTLTAHSNHPCHKPHIYARDFNAYTAEEIESHITPLDSHALFHRVGDNQPCALSCFPPHNCHRPSRRL